MKSLNEQRQAILKAKRDLERERVRMSDPQIRGEILEQMDALLDAAETLKRFESFVQIFSDIFGKD